jgi:hypothetical protein
MSIAKAALGGLVLLAAIVLAAMGSNRVLDAFGVADAKGFTLEQRKENTRERQYEWDRRQFTR